nr:DUF1190 domain-containing protein [Pseudoteredinibacter isoporae]
MRKSWQYRSKILPSLAVLATGGSLSGCGGEDVEVFSTLGDCENRYPLRSQECRYAYDRALAQANNFGPRYLKEADCEFDFGQGECREQSSDNRVWFMPYMSGFAMHDDDYRRSTSLFSSKRRSSPLYKKWVSSQGNILGKQRFGAQSLSSHAFTHKSGSRKIFSKGGFGKLAASKARSGGSFSRGG